jgi:hypothetical protein
MTVKMQNFISSPFSFSAFGEKPPKVIVTGKTFDSVTLSFDHFAPEDYHHGYIAMVRVSRHSALYLT